MSKPLTSLKVAAAAPPDEDEMDREVRELLELTSAVVPGGSRSEGESLATRPDGPAAVNASLSTVGVLPGEFV